MAEHVEREKLLTDICDDMCGLKYTGVCENCRVVALIADAPAADVAPVVHARWISWEEAGNFVPSPDRHECSVCHDAAQVLVNGFELLSDYCPNCGAKMDGGDNDEAD